MAGFYGYNVKEGVGKRQTTKIVSAVGNIIID